METNIYNKYDALVGKYLLNVMGKFVISSRMVVLKGIDWSNTDHKFFTHMAIMAGMFNHVPVYLGCSAKDFSLIKKHYAKCEGLALKRQTRKQCAGLEMSKLLEENYPIDIPFVGEGFVYGDIWDEYYDH